MMRLRQHQDGYLLESAPFGTDYFWRPKQPPLGVGATAYVARCWQLVEDNLRPWAVKVSHINRFNTAERVVEEAKKLRALRGLPGVLQGKGVPYNKDSEAYTVMRLMDSTALSDVIHARHQTAALYNPAWLKSLASQLCKAVAGMHSRKIAWLDGKPDNILCCEDIVTGHLQITVCDFDASMWMRRGPLLRVSKIALRGTEDFSSPELLTGIKLYEDCEYLDELDGEVRDVVAADAWSIGAIIFNAATGQFLVPDGPAFKQVGAATSTSDDEDSEGKLRAAFIMRRHEQWKEEGMEGVWDRLRQATNNDAPLLGFLQQLLSLDPAPRADFAALANHPYLHLDPPPVLPPPSAAAAASDASGLAAATAAATASAAAASAAAASELVMSAATTASGPAAVMTHDAVLEDAVKSTPEIAGHYDSLVAVLGIPFLVFDPTLSPVCETAGGAVYRAWCKTGQHKWQQCLLKRHSVYLTADPETAAGMNGLDDSSDSCSTDTDTDASVSRQVDIKNASVDALLAFQNTVGVPKFQCAFHDGQHYTHFRVFGAGVITLKEFVQSRAAGQSVPALDFRALALRLLQILDALHSKHHFLGVMEPDRILVHPDIYLLELSPGDWSDARSSMQRTCPWQLQYLHHMGIARREACSTAADIYSAGVLLAEVVTGLVPFLGVVGQTDDAEYRLSMVQQAKHQAWRERVEQEVVRQAGPAVAQLLMAMLDIKPSRRPTAAQALHLPFFKQQAQGTPQAGQQNDSRTIGAGAANPGPSQDGSCFTAPPDSISHPTLSHPTSTHAKPSAQDTPSPPSTPKPSRGSDEDIAADRNCSCQGDGESRIEIAARAGQGVGSDAALFDVTRDGNAASISQRSSADASSREGMHTCFDSSRMLHGSRHQTVHPLAGGGQAAAAHPGRKRWCLGAASDKAAQVGSGVAGWVKCQVQAHPKATIGLAAVATCAFGLLVRRHR